MIAKTDILGAKILVVDDQEANLVLLECLLQGAGYREITLCRDSREVFALYREHGYDAILLDVTMPHLDGFDVLEALRPIETLDYVPAIMLTADPSIKTKALQAGARDFVAKPFDNVEVLTRIRNMLEVRLLHKKVRGQSDALANHACLLEQRVADRTAALSEMNVALRREIEEHKHTGAQLVQAQKMELVGQLTGGIAHDFNNLLGIIIGNLDLLGDRMKLEGRPREYFDNALEAALRGAELNKRMLAFARRQSLQPQIVDVNVTLNSMVEMMRRTLGEGIDIRMSLSPEAWAVDVDPAQLESAIVNLAVNARDAMPKGGILTIETQNAALNDDYVARQTELDAGDYTMIAVSDSGVGMSADIASRVFEPFFTTKPVGKGTGLGLSMVFGFIKQSGGHVNIYSEPGHGTTIKLYLPRRSGAAAEKREGAPAAVPIRGAGELVLVVEDNPQMRRTTVDQLCESGYRVGEAETGMKALAMLESGLVPNLVFSDVMMPGGLDGIALAQCLHERFPELPVVLASGFTRQAAANALGRQEGEAAQFALLTKPYRKVDLLQAVHAALAGRARPLPPDLAIP